MNTPKPPPVPQAGDIIRASQNANNINQSTPFGSLSYTQGADGRWTATQSMDPNIVSGVESAIGGANASLNKFANQPGPVDPSGAVDKAVAMENQYMAPWFKQQQSNLDAKLQGEGFAPGTEGYNNAQRDLQTNQTNWVGGNVAQFEPLAYNQSQTSYFDPLQAATGQVGVGNSIRGVGNPGFVSTPQTDVVGAYDTQMKGDQYNYGQQMQNRAAMMGGLFSIPANAAGGWARNGFALPNWTGTV